MQFLYPQFLFALLALAIPVIIHLFNFRRYKKVLFTNVRFLASVQQEHRSRNKLRRLLLLLMRLLALACIVIAFAYPYLPERSSIANPGRKYVSIYVDNSFSMSSQGAQGDLLMTARTRAAEIARAYQEGDAFQLITNEFELRHQRWVNRTDFLRMLDEVNVSPAFRRLSDVYLRMKESFRNAETSNRLAYILSDFQKNMARLDELKTDTSIRLSMLPLQATARNNVYIDSAWFEAPVWQTGRSNTLKVRIVNSSDEPVEEGTLSLKINTVQKPPVSYSVPARSNTTVSMNFTVTEPGFNRAVLSLEDYPVTFDNTLYFNFTVEATLPVLVINGSAPNQQVLRALGAEPTFQVTQSGEGSIDYSGLGKYRFIILNEVRSVSSGLAAALKEFTARTGNVLIIPPAENMNAEAYASFMTALGANRFGAVQANALSLAPLNNKLPFFQNVFEEEPRNISMPTVSRYYSLSRYSSVRDNVLLQLSNGDPFLSLVPAGKGNIYISAVPFRKEWTGLTEHMLFVPALYRMAFFHNQEDRLYYIIGRDNYLAIPAGTEVKENIYQLVKDSFESKPPQRMANGLLSLYTEGIINQAGHYELRTGSGTAPVRIYSFNYNRDESVMEFEPVSGIKTEAARLKAGFLENAGIAASHQIVQMHEGVRLWKWFVIAALAFLLAEVLLIRFWK